MRALFTALALGVALPCMAQSVQTYTCTLQPEQCGNTCAQTSVVFDIDSAQFVAAQNPADPPRRQISTVTLNDATFIAQAIKMPHGVHGFHEDAGALGSRLMIVQRDGTARLTLQPENITLLGTCTSG